MRKFSVGILGIFFLTFLSSSFAVGDNYNYVLDYEGPIPFSDESSQALDQRQLIRCTHDSKQIIDFAMAVRETYEKLGEKTRPVDVSSKLYSPRTLNQLREDVSKRLEVKEDHEDILAVINQAFAKLELIERITSNMIEEAYESPTRYEKMAEFIVQCANNFGGEVYTLEDEIEDLRVQERVLKREKANLEERLNTQKMNFEKRLSKAIRVYENRLNQSQGSIVAPFEERIRILCSGMKAFNHTEFLEKKVYIDSEFYDLCD